MGGGETGWVEKAHTLQSQCNDGVCMCVMAVKIVGSLGGDCERKVVEWRQRMFLRGRRSASNGQRLEKSKIRQGRRGVVVLKADIECKQSASLLRLTIGGANWPLIVLMGRSMWVSCTVWIGGLGQRQRQR